jgi:hypothetical protein
MDAYGAYLIYLFITRRLNGFWRRLCKHGMEHTISNHEGWPGFVELTELHPVKSGAASRRTGARFMFFPGQEDEHGK